eukprot:1980613-Pleurochrysis_carterae.AAC.1
MPSVRDIGPEKRRSIRFDRCAGFSVDGDVGGSWGGGADVARGRPAGCSASPSVGCASDGVVGVPEVFQGKLVSLK